MAISATTEATPMMIPSMRENPFALDYARSERTAIFERFAEHRHARGGVRWITSTVCALKSRLSSAAASSEMIRPSAMRTMRCA